MAKKSYSVVSVVIGGLELCLRDLCWTPTGFGNRGGRSALRGTTCNATSPSRHHGVYKNEWIAGLAWPVSALRLFYADAPRAGTGTGTGRRDRLIILHGSSGAVNRPSPMAISAGESASTSLPGTGDKYASCCQASRDACARTAARARVVLCI